MANHVVPPRLSYKWLLQFKMSKSQYLHMQTARDSPQVRYFNSCKSITWGGKRSPGIKKGVLGGKINARVLVWGGKRGVVELLSVLQLAVSRVFGLLLLAHNAVHTYSTTENCTTEHFTV